MSIVRKGNYLVSRETGERVVFYECDPTKNHECDKHMCRAHTDKDEGSFGFCSKTTNPAFRKEGGKAWYAVLKIPAVGEPYWGREYIEGV